MEKKARLTTEDIYCHETLSTSGSIKNKTKSKNRKNNNRKKKAQKRQLQLKKHLAQWISRIYHLQLNFQDIKSEVIQYLTPNIDSNTFYYFLHRTIENQIELIANQIGKKTRQICEQFQRQGVINPILTAQLYEKIEIILQASPQIQHIINYFTYIKEKTQSEIQQFLDKSTLKYIFDGDSFGPYKDKFFQICERCLEVSKDFKDERQRVLLKKILEIIQAVDEYDRSDSDEEYQDEDQEFYEEYMIRQYENQEMNTALQTKYEQEVEQYKNNVFQGKQNMLKELQNMKKEEEIKEAPKKKKKKKKNKKNKEVLVSQAYVMEVINKLNTMVIDQKKRIDCFISFDNQIQWLQDLKQRCDLDQATDT